MPPNHSRLAATFARGVHQQLVLNSLQRYCEAADWLARRPAAAQLEALGLVENASSMPWWTAWQP
jgi:hypothetical protein